MKIVVIDGQGGSIGKTIIEQLKKNSFSDPIIAIGTNSIATLAMLKAVRILLQPVKTLF
jgi:FlaA1/EpsC-like NDP-sugar epimerase